MCSPDLSEKEGEGRERERKVRERREGEREGVYARVRAEHGLGGEGVGAAPAFVIRDCSCESEAKNSGFLNLIPSEFRRRRQDIGHCAWADLHCLPFCITLLVPTYHRS